MEGCPIVGSQWEIGRLSRKFGSHREFGREFGTARFGWRSCGESFGLRSVRRRDVIRWKRAHSRFTIRWMTIFDVWAVASGATRLNSTVIRSTAPRKFFTSGGIGEFRISRAKGREKRILPKLA